jgi:hypothetical protein
MKAAPPLLHIKSNERRQPQLELAFWHHQRSYHNCCSQARFGTGV